MPDKASLPPDSTGLGSSTVLSINQVLSLCPPGSPPTLVHNLMASAQRYRSPLVIGPRAGRSPPHFPLSWVIVGSP
jgi:hypothetical protein